jgi:Phage major capsid protein E
MSLNEQYVDPVTLTGFVRAVPFPANFTLNQYLPDVTIGDIKAQIREIETTNRAAYFRSWDAETPITKRDGFTVSQVGMPPLGSKLILGEYERILIERLRTGGNNNGPIIEAIYNDAAIIAKEIRTRMEVARGQLLTTGKVTLRENGLMLEYDAGVPGGNFNSASAVWSDTTNADPILDIRTAVEEYEALNGMRPGVAVCSPAAYSYVLLNTKIRALAATLAGAPAVVTRSQVNQVLGAHELPPLVSYAAKANVNGSDVDILDPTKVLFMPSNPRDLGYTGWGITAQGLMLAGGGNPRIAFSEAPGLVGVVETTGDATRIMTSVHAVGLPLLEQPKRLLVLDVL